MGSIIESCYMCVNAFVDGELEHGMDYSAIQIGDMPSKTRLMYCSGGGFPPRIRYDIYDEKVGWYAEGRYYPKFCPNCGRKIVERMGDNPDLFEIDNDTLDFIVKKYGPLPHLVERPSSGNRMNVKEIE